MAGNAANAGMTSTTHAPAVSNEHARSPVIDALTSVSLGMSMVAAIVLVLSVLEPLPFWDTDPAELPIVVNTGTGALGSLNASMTGIGPAMSVMLCMIVVLGALPSLLCAACASSVRLGLVCVLAALGVLVIGYHALFKTGLNPDAARIGCAWIAAVIGGIGAAHASHRARTLCIALSVGTIGLLVVQGLVQVTLTHPLLVENFAQTRDRFFSAKGWLPDSSLAQMYERRLGQREMSGWFGLSNVFATFPAALTVVFAMLLAGSARRALRTPRGVTAGYTLGLLVSLVALIGSGSKGAIAAAAFGVMIVIGVRLFRLRTAQQPKHTSHLWLVIGIGTIAMPLIAIVARGMIGTRMGELSLLFRWFYISSAARIAGAHMPMGTGPDGFKQAYTTHGHPLSPEQVSSPHSILFDLVATLGIGGIALSAIVVVAAICSSRAMLVSKASVTDAAHTPSVMPLNTKRWVYTLLGIFSVCAIVATMLQPASSMPITAAEALEQLHAMSADTSLLVGVGIMAVAIAISTVIALAGAWAAHTHPVATSAALGAGGLVLVAHAQIEMTPIITTAAPIFGILLGLCSHTPAQSAVRSTERTGRFISVTPSLVLSCAAVFVCGVSAQNVSSWESHLVRAARSLEPVSTLHDAVATFDPNSLDAHRTANQINTMVAQLRAQLPADAAPTEHEQHEQANPGAWVRAFRAHFGAVAEQQLALADAKTGCAHTPTTRARIENLIAVASTTADQTERDQLTMLIHTRSWLATSNTSTDPIDAWRLRATILSDPSLLPTTRMDIQVPTPIIAWLQVIDRDPRSLEARLRLIALLHEAAGTDDKMAAVLAAQCEMALKLHDRMKLDPLGQLSEHDRVRLEGWAVPK